MTQEGRGRGWVGDFTWKGSAPLLQGAWGFVGGAWGDCGGRL